jgi:hypothetical protein
MTMSIEARNPQTRFEEFVQTEERNATVHADFSRSPIRGGHHFRAIGLKRLSSVKMLRRMSGQPLRIFPEYTCID